MRVGIRWPEFHEHAYRRWRGEEFADVIFLDGGPGYARVGEIRRTFPYQYRCAITPWAIYHRTMTHDPTDIRHAPVDIVLFEIKGQLCIISSTYRVAAMHINTALRRTR